ncbi:MAG: sarcosine oxidase subunit gamma family protein [Sphingomonas sp.]
MAETTLPQAAPAFPRLAALAEALDDASLAAGERAGLAIASIHCRPGHEAALAAAVAPGLATGPRLWRGKELTLVGTGPGAWLALTEDPAPDWAQGLAARLAGIASVSDQSSGYAVLRLRGAAAAEVLARGPHIDLAPPAFAPGSAAVTAIGHIGVILWREDAAPGYEVAVFRSLADSFWRWLETAAAGAGCAIRRLR